MRRKLFLGGLMISTTLLALSCTSTPKVNEDKTAEILTSTNEDVFNKDSVIIEIDNKRATIETLDLDFFELSTANLREKIKQKWSKIHFYFDGDDLVKIKAYPHSGISKRTEEFYIDNSNLILVVIEDDGTGEKGKSNLDLDKMYYFHNENLIQELKSNQEVEYNIKNGDSEELQAEFQEYVEIFRSEKK